jgi:hypothetical protein
MNYPPPLVSELAFPHWFLVMLAPGVVRSFRSLGCAAHVGAEAKIKKITARLAEPSNSYNALFAQRPPGLQSFVVFLLLLLKSAMDNEHTSRVAILSLNSVPVDTETTDLPECAKEVVRVSSKVHYIQALTSIAVSLHLLTLLDGNLDAVSVYLGLIAISQLMFSEAKEFFFFDKIVTDNPMRNMVVQMFNSSRSDNDADCAICLESIREAEWIYPIPCRHRFHRWCLMKSVQNPGHCKRCPRLTPQCPGGRCPMCRALFSTPFLCDVCQHTQRELATCPGSSSDGKPT